MISKLSKAWSRSSISSSAIASLSYSDIFGSFITFLRLLSIKQNILTDLSNFYVLASISCRVLLYSSFHLFRMPTESMSIVLCSVIETGECKYVWADYWTASEIAWDASVQFPRTYLWILTYFFINFGLKFTLEVFWSGVQVALLYDFEAFDLMF